MPDPNENGQTMAEYGLILALIVVGLIAVTVLIGNPIESMWNDFVGAWPA